jgi:DNA polymerase-3 subunit beta
MVSPNPVLEQSILNTEKKGFKVIVLRAHLLNLIGKIQSAVPSKPAMPILSNLLLEAQNDQLILSATDLTVSVKAFTEAKVIQKGSITLLAKRFFQLIRELTCAHVEIEVGPSNVVFVRAGGSLFKLHGVSVDEFPTLADFSKSPFITLHSPTLKELFIRTSFATARDDSRHVLNGVLFQLTHDKLILIGTDGKRLAKINAELDAQPTHGNYIVPLKAMEEMIKCLDDEESAKLYLSGDKIGLETSSAMIMTKLLIGEYPDVSRVIPTKSHFTVNLHREELITLLRQVALFTSEMSHSVRFTFTDGQLELSAISSDVGEGKVSMPVDYAGQKFEIAFNPHFFIDILKHCKDESVTFGITDSFNPGLITDQTTALFVIMPMRLASN